MAKCFMCGASIAEGILCLRCDVPRRSKGENDAVSAQAPMRVVAHDPIRREVSAQSASGHPIVPSATVPVLDFDPFPEATVLPFPVESASLAVTSVVNLLIATGAPAVLLGSDRSVKFVTEEGKALFGSKGGSIDIGAIERRAGVTVGPLNAPVQITTSIDGRSATCSLVPLSGGAAGAVLVFRFTAESQQATSASFVRETVLAPLQALRESVLAAAAAQPTARMFLVDAASALDQILSSLELEPARRDEPVSQPLAPTVSEVVRGVVERFRRFAELKNVRLETNVQEIQQSLADHVELAEVLDVLLSNAMHYVPAGGQVVAGVRPMEHKGNPLFLFFVMDNGPLVPEPLRQKVFEADFPWNPSAPERTGRSLARVRDYAAAHAGSAWIDSRTGKACTFFVRVQPDGA